MSKGTTSAADAGAASFGGVDDSARSSAFAFAFEFAFAFVFAFAFDIRLARAAHASRKACMALPSATACDHDTAAAPSASLVTRTATRTPPP